LLEVLPDVALKLAIFHGTADLRVRDAVGDDRLAIARLLPLLGNALLARRHHRLDVHDAGMLAHGPGAQEFLDERSLLVERRLPYRPRIARHLRHLDGGDVAKRN